MTFDPDKFVAELRLARDRREAKLKHLRHMLDEENPQRALHVRKAEIVDSEIMTLNVIMTAVDLATAEPPAVTEFCLSCGKPSRPDANTCWGCTAVIP